MRSRGIVLAGLGILFLAGAAFAGEKGASVRTEGGEVNGVTTLILDGRFPDEGEPWNSDRCVWWEQAGVSLLIDLKQPKLVRDIHLQVDNNDRYDVDYSLDGIRYHNLFHIQEDHGEISDGMDTLSSEEGNPEYEPAIDFKPVKARFLRIRAVGGDDMYAVAEVDVVADPIP
ncbi:MAG: discoidin domain-containing protein [Acidobacteria bacterium]|nr:discoidin domain-containing protein [Acidobacteriota bacterium]